MFKTSRHKRRPDFIMWLTIFVCLGVVLTTSVNAAEPQQSWGIQVSADDTCEQSTSTWLKCSSWQQPGVHTLQPDHELAVPQRAALRFSSERLPDTGVVAYYTLSRELDSADTEKQFNNDINFNNAYDSPRQFGMALKQRYGSFGLSVGFEANRVDNLTDDPLIYFGVSNSW